MRETAKSYLSVGEPARRWFVADGIILDAPSALWIKESEDALILNPGTAPARVELALHFQGSVIRHAVEVPARRLRRVAMDPLARANTNYGTAFTSDEPVVVHWRRAVYWYDSDEVMAFWSLPALPLAEPR